MWPNGTFSLSSTLVKNQNSCVWGVLRDKRMSSRYEFSILWGKQRVVGIFQRKVWCFWYAEIRRSWEMIFTLSWWRMIWCFLISSIQDILDCPPAIPFHQQQSRKKADFWQNEPLLHPLGTRMASLVKWRISLPSEF